MVTLAGCVRGGAVANTFIYNLYGLLTVLLQWGGVKVGAVVVGFGQTKAGGEFVGLLPDTVYEIMAVPNLRVFEALSLVIFKVVCELFDTHGVH